jgi:large subunit ribosomal protein L13
MTTTFPKVSQIKQKWHVIDAKDQVLGRLATRIANLLRGKHKASYTPHLDTGDFVVVINADKVAVTGRKREKKIYQRYSGYPGGQTVQTLDEVITRHPERVIQKAVKGMMPEGPLGRSMFSKLKVYKGERHPHQAQKPELLPAI